MSDVQKHNSQLALENVSLLSAIVNGDNKAVYHIVDEKDFDPAEGMIGMATIAACLVEFLSGLSNEPTQEIILKLVDLFEADLTNFGDEE